MTTEQEPPFVCRLCGVVLESREQRELDLGSIPIGNRFTVDGRVDRYPLAMIACPHCALIQLSRYPSVEAITPRVPFIRYNEPDQHLDGVIARLELPQPRRVLGTGPFDGPLLERLTRNGGDAETIELREPAASPRYPYLETLAARLSEGALAARVSERADIVVCRYLLEHCHAPLAALDALRGAATDDGVLIVEVPDSTSFLRRCDYSFPWEEHAVYFSEATLATTAKRAGLDIVAIVRSPGALEDSLLAVLRKGPAQDPVADREGAALFERYRSRFADTRDAWARFLRKTTSDGSKLAVFGAGHQAIMFVNALGLNDFVAAMVDDHPDKRGLVPPGLRSPVISSADMLADPSFTTCLLAVSPRAEAAVITKCAPLRERGGVFHSIFASPVPI